MLYNVGRGGKWELVGVAEGELMRVSVFGFDYQLVLGGSCSRG